MNSRVMIFLAVLLILGASVAGYLGYQTTVEARSLAESAVRQAEKTKAAAAQGVPGKVPVVILRQNVQAFHELTADDLIIDYLKVAPPATYRTLEEVIGQPVQVDLEAGSLLTRMHLRPGSEVARLLRPGERAVAIPIDEVIGGGGFVQPGDLVDLLLFLRGENGGRDSAQIVMQSVRVLGFGSEIISQTGGTVTPDDKTHSADRTRARTAVLAVAEADVTRLMLASSLGTLRLAIVPTAQVSIASGSVGNTPAVTDISRAPAQAVAGKSGGLPAVSVTPASSRSAAPQQKQFLTSAALQAAAPRAVAAPRPVTPAAPRRQAEPPVMIYRGIAPQVAP